MGPELGEFLLVLAWLSGYLGHLDCWAVDASHWRAGMAQSAGLHPGPSHSICRQGRADVYQSWAPTRADGPGNLAPLHRHLRALGRWWAALVVLLHAENAVESTRGWIGISANGHIGAGRPVPKQEVGSAAPRRWTIRTPASLRPGQASRRVTLPGVWRTVVIARSLCGTGDSVERALSDGSTQWRETPLLETRAGCQLFGCRLVGVDAQ